MEGLDSTPGLGPERRAVILTPALLMNIGAAIACVSIMAVTTGLSWPLLALVLDGKGYGSFAIGVNAAAQSLGMTATGFAAPAILERFGFFHSCAGAIAVSSLLFLLFPVLDHFVAWAALRFILGGCSSLLFTAGESWLLHITPESHRGRAIGMLGLIWGGSFALGPVLVSLVGTQGFTPYVLGAIAAGLAGVPVLIGARSAAASVSRSSGVGMFDLLRRHPAPLLALALLGVVEVSEDSLLAIYGVRNGMPQERAAFLVTVAVAGVSLVQPLAGWAADKFNGWTLIRLLPLFGCLFTLCFGFLNMSDWQWPMLFLLGCVNGSLWAVGLALAGSVFTAEELTRVNSLRTILFGMAAMAGPAITGAAMDAYAATGFIAALALAWVIYAGVTWMDKGEQ